MGMSAMASTLNANIAKALAIPANNRTGTIRDVEHIVILMQENNSFDKYFGTLRGVRGHSFEAVEMALALMKAGTIDLEAMSTHEFGLDDVDEALRLVAGEIRDKNGNMSIHVTIDPWGK